MTPLSANFAFTCAAVRFFGIGGGWVEMRGRLG